MHTLNGASSPGAPFPRGVTRARRSRVTCSLKEPIKLHKDVNTTSIVVIERRAADVAVIGDDPSAFLTAYTLAKGGKKVILLPSFGLSAATPGRARRQPLKLTDVADISMHLNSESAQYWRGLELLTQASFLKACSSIDFAVDADGDHPGAVALEKLIEASRSAGVRFAVQRADELAVRFRQLSLPNNSTVVLQPDAGLLLSDVVSGALTKLARQAGAMVKENLHLRGWRDAGDFFQLKASSSLLPDSLSLFEVEQVVLMPATVVPPCLKLFGLDSNILRHIGQPSRIRNLLHHSLPQHMEGTTVLFQVREFVEARCSGGPELTALPVWQYWGCAGHPSDRQQHSQPMSGLPASQRTGQLSMFQSPASGTPVEDVFVWRPHHDTAQAMANTLHDTASSFIRDVSPEEDVTSLSRLCSTADGLPAVGWHPGFEAGRIAIGCALSSNDPYGPGSWTYQAAPMLAKLTADLVLDTAGAAQASLYSTLSPSRESVGLDANSLGSLDTWEQLQLLQVAKARTREQDEEDRRTDE
eukprot:jgi/Chrzof1/513/Cz01g18170.t1